MSSNSKVKPASEMHGAYNKRMKSLLKEIDKTFAEITGGADEKVRKLKELQEELKKLKRAMPPKLSMSLSPTRRGRYNSANAKANARYNELKKKLDDLEREFDDIYLKAISANPPGRFSHIIKKNAYPERLDEITRLTELINKELRIMQYGSRGLGELEFFKNKKYGGTRRIRKV